MRRRELMILLGGAMTATRALRAQQKAMPVIGFFHLASAGAAASFVAVLRGTRRALIKTPRNARLLPPH
jgi:hypothetical protein